MIRYKSEKINSNFSYQIQQEKKDTLNVTLTAYGRDYTNIVSSDKAATDWIERRIKELQK